MNVRALKLASNAVWRRGLRLSLAQRGVGGAQRFPPSLHSSSASYPLRARKPPLAGTSQRFHSTAAELCSSRVAYGPHELSGERIMLMSARRPTGEVFFFRSAASSTSNSSSTRMRSSEGAEPTSSVSGGGGMAGFRNPLFVTYHDLEQALKRRGYSLYRLGFSTVLAVALVAALYWRQIKQWGAQEGAELASKTLEDQRLQMKAEEIAKSIVNALFSDTQTSSAVRAFFHELMSDEHSRDLAYSFVAETFTHVTSDERLMQRASEFFGKVFREPVVMASAVELGTWVVSQPQFRNQGLQSLQSVLHAAEMKDEGLTFVADALSRAVQSCGVKDEAMSSAHEVLQEDSFRKALGESLWAATKSGFLGVRAREPSSSTGDRALSEVP